MIDITSLDWPLLTTFLGVSIPGKTSEQMHIEFDSGIHCVMPTCHVVRFVYTNLMQPLVSSLSDDLRLHCLCHERI